MLLKYGEIAEQQEREIRAILKDDNSHRAKRDLAKLDRYRTYDTHNKWLAERKVGWLYDSVLRRALKEDDDDYAFDALSGGA